MDPQPAQTVYKEIVGHMRKQGGPYFSWYSGITSDWEDRLFNAHRVARENHWYIARQCYSENDARAVEQELLKLGCDGGEGGGDPETVYVYAYLKTQSTKP